MLTRSKPFTSVAFQFVGFFPTDFQAKERLLAVYLSGIIGSKRETNECFNTSGAIDTNLVVMIRHVQFSLFIQFGLLGKPKVLQTADH